MPMPPSQIIITSRPYFFVRKIYLLGYQILTALSVPSKKDIFSHNVPIDVKDLLGFKKGKFR
jgi:hypothetical protein